MPAMGMGGRADVSPGHPWLHPQLYPTPCPPGVLRELSPCFPIRAFRIVGKSPETEPGEGHCLRTTVLGQAYVPGTTSCLCTVLSTPQAPLSHVGQLGPGGGDGEHLVEEGWPRPHGKHDGECNRPGSQCCHCSLLSSGTSSWPVDLPERRCPLLSYRPDDWNS